MVFEFTLFGFQLFSMSLFKVEAIADDGYEHISNFGGDFERREIPFGFSALPYSEGYDDEEEDE